MELPRLIIRSVLSLALVVSFSPVVTSHNETRGRHSNISSILDQILDGYDSKKRPGINGNPSIIKVDLNIRSMGPVSEVDMAFSMDAYFRQTWVDERLSFVGPPKVLAVHIKMLERIWKPDTYFFNGRGSYLHTTTTPNKLLRITEDGTVLYSMRLTIKSSCPMFLQYFPIDDQLCPLQFGSYAFTKKQVKYIWKHGPHDSIALAKDMTLSQFDLKDYAARNVTVKNRSGEFSMLLAEFRLQRHMGYFLIQVYVPCTLIVVLSWVSFWLNREATADRIGLGITSVLTLTTLCLDSRTDLPKVSYATALDWFILMCFGFIIASMLEFAGVHYFTKLDGGETPLDEDDAEQEDQCNTNDLDHCKTRESLVYVPPYTNQRNHVNSVAVRHNSNAANSCHTQSVDSEDLHLSTSCFKKFLLCLQSNKKYKHLMMKRANKSGVNSVSAIDKVSRVLFPLAFTTLNVLYWLSYTNNIST